MYRNRAPYPYAFHRTGYSRRMYGKGSYYYKPSAAYQNLLKSRIMGKGGYWKDLWLKGRGYIPRALGGAWGAATGFARGGPLGATTGALSGWGQGANFSKKILGWGAYSSGRPTQGPQSRQIIGGNVPTMHGIGEGGIRICHKEAIGVLNSSIAFTVNTYEVNPALNTTFPWLSGVARNFQQYDINGLWFVYKPTCSDALTAATISPMGSVTITTDQNVYATAPISTVAAMQSKFSVSGKPSSELVCQVEEDRRIGGKMTNHLLTRTGAIPAGATLQFYDDCKLYVCTDGNGVDDVQLGQLFVTYDISFYNPVQYNEAQQLEFAKYKIQEPLTNALLGADAGDFMKVYDNMGIVRNGVMSFTIPAGFLGRYVMVYHHDSAGANVIPATSWTINGVTPSQCWINDNDTYAYGPSSSATGCTRVCVACIFDITDTTIPTVIVFNAGWVIDAGATFGDLVIAEVNPNWALP